MSPAEYDKSLDQIRTLDLGAIRQLDATGEDGSPLLELCVDPGRRARRAARAHGAARRCWRRRIARAARARAPDPGALLRGRADAGRDRRGHRRRASRACRSCARWRCPACAPACATSLGRSRRDEREQDPLAGRDRRAARRRPPSPAAARRAPRCDSRASRSSATTSAARTASQGADPLAALPARPLRAQRRRRRCRPSCAPSPK